MPRRTMPGSALLEIELAAEVRRRGLQPIFQLYLRLPSEQSARARDVGPALLRVVLRQGAHGSDAAAAAHHLPGGLCELDQRHLAGIAQVHRPRVAFREQGEEPRDQIVDVAEAAGLRTVAENGEVLASQRLG